MRHDDICVITRSTTIKDPKTHIAKPQNVNLEPFNCRLGRASGNLTQATPQGVFIQQLRLYIPNTSIDIKSGDIATINNITKYIVGNVYKPNRHHIEVDVTYKEEV
jgi:hypothetical protein